MPSNIRNPRDQPDKSKPKNEIPPQMDFEVLEWLEGERLEHERRMQELGCIPESAKESQEHHEKQRRQDAGT